MSERSGRPVSSRTARRISSPFSSPGPRNDSIELRLALSNEDLKTRLMPSSSRSATSVRAIPSACSRDSITHGPAMKRGGGSPPKEIVSVIRIARVVGPARILNQDPTLGPAPPPLLAIPPPPPPSKDLADRPFGPPPTPV